MGTFSDKTPPALRDSDGWGNLSRLGEAARGGMLRFVPQRNLRGPRGAARPRRLTVPNAEIICLLSAAG